MSDHSDLAGLIHILRGQRHPEQFPPDFMFELTRGEIRNISQMERRRIGFQAPE